MIFIAVKYTLRPEYADSWPARVEDFTLSTRQEPGNVFFEWSRSLTDPNQYVLLEAFASGEAGEAHVNSRHFKTAMEWMPEAIAMTPDIINIEVPGNTWSAMAELSPVERP